MKYRIKSLLLGLVLTLPLFSPVVAYADSASLYLSPASGSVSKGSYLTISIRENSGGESVNSVQANLSYPANLLDFVSISSSTAWGLVAENSGGEGSVKIARGAQPAVSGDQLVASVKFKAKVDTGTASLSFATGSAVVSASSNSDIKSGDSGGNYTLKAPAAAPAEAPKDTTPPVIKSISVSEITATTAVVTWTTSEPSTSEVSYGPTEKYGIAATDSNNVTDHKITLSSPLITPGTKYHYMVKSTDPSGNSVSSSDATFITIGATLVVSVTNQSNKPVKGAKVTFGDITGKTDAKGQATLTNLPLGKQTGVVIYKNQQVPVSVQLDTLLAKNNGPNTVKVKIQTPNNIIFWIVIGGLLALIAVLIFYRRGGGGKGRFIFSEVTSRIPFNRKKKEPTLTSQGITGRHPTLTEIQTKHLSPDALIQDGTPDKQ